MIDLRVRSRVHPDELAAKVGKVVTERDANVLLCGPARVTRPDGALLCVYLPGVLAAELDAAWPTLTRIRMTTDNRGKASGTPRVQRGDQKRARTRLIMSATLGAVDPGPASSAAGRLPACRLTAWTGRNLAAWADLTPLWQAIAAHYQQAVPDRYAAQQRWAAGVHRDWRIPGTPFTTVTVNNTYSTGVHQDAGDLKDGFSTLAVCRRGPYEGGWLVLPAYRVAAPMRHGDLLLFDPHQWHGNTAVTCPHTDGPLAKPCPDGCERISVVAYARTKVAGCDSALAELAKGQAHTDRLLSPLEETSG